MKFNGKTKKRFLAEDRAFESISVYVSKTVAGILKQKSIEEGSPVARLVAIAIDNELDQEKPFNYPLNLPEKPATEEYLYAKEMGQLIKFFEANKEGFSLDQLVLLRLDIGISSREILLAAFAELLYRNLIVSYRPVRTKFAYFKSDYVHYRIKTQQDAENE